MRDVTLGRWPRQAWLAWRLAQAVLVGLMATATMASLAAAPRSGARTAAAVTQKAASAIRPTTSAAPASAEAWRHWRGVLYRLTAPPIPGHRASVGHILGTVHFGSAEELALDATVVQQAMRRARLFIDEAPAPSGSWPARWRSHTELPAGQRLQDWLGSAASGRLQDLLDTVAPHTLQQMKPWTVLALLESRGERIGPHTLDRRLVQWAGHMQLPVFHLETFEAQLQALDCVPAEQHAQVLRQRLATPWLFAERSQRVLEFYRAGDLPAWLEEVDAMTGLDEAGRRIEHAARLCLIEDRNALWLEQLDPLLRATNAFVAVGAIHLTGEQGLLNALQQRGFAIEPVDTWQPYHQTPDTAAGAASSVPPHQESRTP